MWNFLIIQIFFFFHFHRIQIPAISDQLSGLLNLTQPMDTVFVKEVRPNGPAYVAGLNAGDRLLSVNGLPVAGTPYNCVVKTIQQASTTLKLIVVPRECDILQTVSDQLFTYCQL